MSLLDVEVCEVPYWRKKVIQGENLFHDFLQSNNLEENLGALRRWLEFFRRELTRSPEFDEDDFNDALSLARKFATRNDPLSDYLKGRLAPETHQLLTHCIESSQIPQRFLTLLAKHLNGIISEASLYNQERFKHVELSNQTKELLKQNPTDIKLIPLNRMLLEDAYPLEINRKNMVIDYKNYDIFLQQWQHAAKLYVCARFVEENRESFLSIREKNKDTFLSDKVEELASALFTEKTGISRVEAILICSIFYEKPLSSEVRQIPFSTASDGKSGQIYVLELRRIKSYKLAIQNPCVFPHVNNYSNKYGKEFSEAINLALQLNVSLWDEYKNNLESEINRLDELLKSDESKGSVNKSKLKGLKKDLNFVENLGDINRYGILWDVKPYELPTDNSKADEDVGKPIPPIDGKSIGLAAFFGIYFTLRDKYPEERAIFSVKLAGNGDKLELEKVDGIEKKIKAAIKINQDTLVANPEAIPPFDGFGIHKDNLGDLNGEILDLIKANQFQIFVFIHEDNLGELGENLWNIIKANQFQLFVLDDNGSVIKTFPEKSETANPA